MLVWVLGRYKCCECSYHDRRLILLAPLQNFREIDSLTNFLLFKESHYWTNVNSYLHWPGLSLKVFVFRQINSQEWKVYLIGKIFSTRNQPVIHIEIDNCEHFFFHFVGRISSPKPTLTWMDKDFISIEKV